MWGKKEYKQTAETETRAGFLHTIDKGFLDGVLGVSREEVRGVWVASKQHDVSLFGISLVRHSAAGGNWIRICTFHTMNRVETFWYGWFLAFGCKTFLFPPLPRRPFKRRNIWIREIMRVRSSCCSSRHRHVLARGRTPSRRNVSQNWRLIRSGVDTFRHLYAGRSS